MISIAHGLSYIDLNFIGVPRVIATAVVHGPGGVALVDPGPSTSWPALRAALARAGIALGDVNALLLTHIHLDHAGASGTLVRENPRLRVYVHEKGARHMADPTKLVASAARLYGADMDRLWGEVLPVPAAALVILKGGERVIESGREFEVAWTPGHASHHVSYFHADTGVAFVGDTAGIRVAPAGAVLPPTPPPDIDLEAWRDSIARIAAWHPSTLFLTHFGPSASPAPHLAELVDSLERAATLVKRSLELEGTDEEREAWYIEETRRELKQLMSDADAYTCEVAARFDLSWRGLARYWRTRESR